ncbi:hypothetical protein SAMN05421753_101533 [Planctomicrobium piriforme]|uniref:Uncharacterized protein n=1 Tax=Planctomicrobium piriforme TaxID=1576369 RepID=A0A1I3BMB7_9PLAN|nr:hypothetical protein SAMN05421753_101533 [Planctomicrobium piriforme]
MFRFRDFEILEPDHRVGKEFVIDSRNSSEATKFRVTAA